jgi:hypothetical protein
LFILLFFPLVAIILTTGTIGVVEE